MPHWKPDFWLHPFLHLSSDFFKTIKRSKPFSATPNETIVATITQYLFSACSMKRFKAHPMPQHMVPAPTGCEESF